MGCQGSDHASNYEKFIEVVKKRRSVRRFEKGRKVDRETLLKIASPYSLRRFAGHRTEYEISWTLPCSGTEAPRIKS